MIAERTARRRSPSRKSSSTSTRSRRCCSARRAARRSAPRCLHGLPVAEYTALQVKQAVVGNGHAAKEQVQEMVKRLLQLAGDPSADAADALACAICHAHGGQGLGSARDGRLSDAARETRVIGKRQRQARRTSIRRRSSSTCRASATRSTCR